MPALTIQIPSLPRCVRSLWLASNVKWHGAARRRTVAELARAVIAPAVCRAARGRTARQAAGQTAGVTTARAHRPEVEAARNNDGRSIVRRCAVAELTEAVIPPAISVGKLNPISKCVDRAASVMGACTYSIREVEPARDGHGDRTAGHRAVA